MGLYGRWGQPVVDVWLGDKQFIGTIPYAGDHRACYGWSKTEGRSFHIYHIDKGHIEKLGTVKYDELVDNSK